MGLMKILTRRSGKSTPEPRSYEFEPPVGLPVHSNVQDGYVDKTEASTPSRLLRPQLSLASLTSKSSLEPPFRSEMVTPEPSLFRHRNLSSFRRPSTAASSDSTYFDHKGMQRPKREPRRPPVSFRKPSSMVSLSHAYQASSIEDRGSENGSLLGTPRGRTDSITSAGSGRFKDLLDAQEEIRPIDFRTRLAATGARDYGEDVADRNMRQNTTGDHDDAPRAALHWHETSGPDPPPSRSGRLEVPDPPPSRSGRLEVPATPPSRSGRLEVPDPPPPRSGRLEVPATPPSRSGRLEVPAIGTRTQSLTSSSYYPQHNSPHMTKSKPESPIADSASLKESENRRNVVKPNAKRLSLHIYTPSGLTSLNTQRFTPVHDGARSPVWPSWGLENTSRPHCVSPSGSNFSVPRSPRNGVGTRFAPGSPRAKFATRDVDFLDEDRVEEPVTPIVSDRKPSLESRALRFSRPRAATARLSNQSYRYSFASSVTSRHTSSDYTALDYPRMLNNDINDYSDNDGVHSQERSLRSRPQSLGHISTISSGLRPGPSASKGSSYIEDRSECLHSSGAQEWQPPTPSNAGSTSSASNPSYSGSTGRPQSRYTKATSIDSEHFPLSSRRSDESCRSTTFGQRASSPVCSHRTTRSTDFNIDDYISSDEESFTTERKISRPVAEGEEDLLFKPGYGTSGEALPGLSEAAEDDSCPPPVVRDIRSMRTISTLPDDEEDLDAAEPADIEDDRISVDRDLPMTFLRHSRNILEYEMGTLGRRAKSWRPIVKKTTSMPNTEVSIMSGDSEYYTPPASANELRMYDEEAAPIRGLQRLSAFGTWYGRKFSVPDAMGDAVSNADQDEFYLEDAYEKEATEKIDVSTAVRMRKAAKAQKRAEDAKINREKRLTRAFGNLEEEIAALLRMQNQEEFDEANGDQITVGGREVATSTD